MGSVHRAPGAPTGTAALGYCGGMTASPVAVERKVRQLDNDVPSIYDLLAAIQGTPLRHGNRFDELDDKMTSLESKVDGLDGRMTSLEARMTSLEGKVDGLAEGMQSVPELLRALSQRLGQAQS